jgi:predicted secreted protein
MGYKAGNLLKVKIDTTAAVGLRSKELNYTLDLAEATTDDSTGSWKEYVPLQKGGTVSIDGLYNPDLTGENLWDFIAKLKNGTQVTLYWGGIETGDSYEEASAFINDVTHSGEYTDIQNYSVEMTITGEPETKTVS